MEDESSHNIPVSQGLIQSGAFTPCGQNAIRQRRVTQRSRLRKEKPVAAANFIAVVC